MRRLLTVRSFRTEISIKIIITNWHYHHDDHHLACTSHAHLFDVWVWVWLNKKVKSENAGRYARDHPNCDCECMYILHRFATINVQAASLYPSHSHHVASPLAQNSPALRSHRQFIALQTNEIKKLARMFATPPATLCRNSWAKRFVVYFKDFSFVGISSFHVEWESFGATPPIPIHCI